MSNASPFTGPERIEYYPPFGRPTRMGSPEELAVSDVERVRQAVRQGKKESARAYLDLFEPLHYHMITTYLEWGCAMVSLSAERFGAAEERRITAEACALWRGDGVPESSGRRALSPIFTPSRLTPDAVSEFRSAAPPPESALPNLLNAEPRALLHALRSAIDAADDVGALKTLEEYVRSVRERHDLIGQFVATYAGRVEAAHGQERAGDLVQNGLESCAVLEGMWSFVANNTPEAVAVMLAEHLRAHFSGPEREGTVTIVDEPERFRLVFDPCGSGGAMRRGRVRGLTIFGTPAADTWFRKDEVPSYCSHCARNELTSLRRFGYLAWVTEFNADPDRPCGWTVYKDRSRIPAEYYARLSAAVTA